MNNILYCKQYGTEQTAPIKEQDAQARAHGVCFHDETLSERHLKILSGSKKQKAFSGQKKKGLNTQDMQQSNTLILSKNVDQKSLETEFSIALCMPDW